MSAESEVGDDAVSDRILTVPNLLSIARLVGAPVFLYLVLTGRDGAALVVLTISAITDYLDGKIARAFHLESRLGALLDPVADRLYILATLFGLAWRDIIPWWVVALIIGRDVFLGLLMLALKRVGQTGLPVNVVGKAATLNLLYAFPILLGAEVFPAAREVLLALGWAFAWWGIGLYFTAAALYVGQGLRVIASRRGVR